MEKLYFSNHNKNLKLQTKKKKKKKKPPIICYYISDVEKA